MTDSERLTDMMYTHERIVFFGGAGMSTESGIPDFRGANGLYRQKTDLPWTPEEMLSHHFYREHTAEFFTSYKNWAEAMEQAEPNRAHYALSELERRRKLTAVVTQNIDGLHQRAGSRSVWEVHGSIMRNTCQSCGAKYGLDEFLSLCDPVPRCPKCGGVVKPDVVLYEEGLDTEIIRGAIEAISQADMLIIGGTSLVVYPAASFIDYFHGDAMVLINQDPTPRDSGCSLIFRDSAGKVLNEALERLEGKLDVQR